MTIDISKGGNVVCIIDGKKFVATTLDYYEHILQEHGKELWLRGPNVCRKFHDLVMTFYTQTD